MSVLELTYDGVMTYGIDFEAIYKREKGECYCLN